MSSIEPTQLIANGRVWSGVASIAETTIAEQRGRIVALGSMNDLLRRYPQATVQDVGGRLVTPGFIDCHTHIVHAGNRATEIERRLAGESYQNIARDGGGILATVTATRAATLQQLLDSALPRVDALLAEGVTTLEVKSGYGLDLDTELRMLQTANELGRVRPLSVMTTYLGAHAVPPEFNGNTEHYLDRLCNEWIPAIAKSGTAQAFDAYCESIAFTVAQVARAFAAASAHGLSLKLTPTSFPICTALHWPRNMRRCQPITWNTPTLRVLWRWPQLAPWPCCCRGRTTFCANRNAHPSKRCGALAWPWLSRPIAIQGLRRSPQY